MKLVYVNFQDPMHCEAFDSNVKNMPKSAAYHDENTHAMVFDSESGQVVAKEKYSDFLVLQDFYDTVTKESMETFQHVIELQK